MLYGSYPIQDLLAHPQLELFTGDFRHASVAARAVNGADAVVHLGAIVGDPACALDANFTIQTNVQGSLVLAELCKTHGVPRFLFASSCSVYGASDQPLDETSALSPVSLYAETKIQIEQALLGMQDTGFAPVILRFATAFGHSRRPRFDLVVNLLTAKALMEGQITIHGGEQWRPFIHVDDIGRAVHCALEAPLDRIAGEIFNVGSSEQNHQLATLGFLIQEAVPTARIVTSNNTIDSRNYYVCFDKVRHVLDFTTVHDLPSSIQTLRRVLESGAVGDYRDVRYDNCRFLRDGLRDDDTQDGLRGDDTHLGEPVQQTLVGA
jgi:nucleoside-diphosphate-sugar epimerase